MVLKGNFMLLCKALHKNMNRLVLYSGESISYSQVPRLCQKCHGPASEALGSRVFR